MLSKMFIILMLVLPGLAYAEIEQSTDDHVVYVLRNESCDRNLKELAIELCKVSDPENFKEVHQEKFHMRTNAENSLEEHFVFTNWWNIVQIKRYTDFNEPATYDRSQDYCYIQVSCLQ